MNQKSQQPALVLHDLTKSYGSFTAIDQISLEVKTGEIFGFLGPNGAGKTTAIRTIMNFLRPTSGTATVLGLDSAKNSREVKSLVGYLAGDYELYDNLTGSQYLEFIANLRSVENVQEQIHVLAEKLEANLHKKLGVLSRGNMQKIALIAALLHDPELLILDEPTTGLDPLMQNRFYEIMRERAKRGKTVFMSSHILSEVQNICDRVAFMKDGKIINIVDVDSLKKSAKKEVHLVINNGTKLMKIPNFKDLEVLVHTKTQLRFITSEAGKDLLSWLSMQPVTDVSIQNVSLEEVFLKQYGSEAGVTHV